MEERFQSWDTGSYDANCFFETLEGSFLGAEGVDCDEAVVRVGRKQE